ncbi:MYND-type domain-containing protein [Mycena venus]|uniref:MYND-type domain-containing protein n=1 Tax=Mycena venus TaxID=2733690 RepID=A0A8H6XJ76_9AGAR|nr:MYND-type domain-containing protein [Mycena venus]
MHSSLSIKSLSKLPVSVRTVATAAASGSFAAWQKIAARLLADPGIPAHKFLPVVFANLDPARIPDTTTPELACSSGSDAVIMAYNALFTVSHFRELPFPILEALWVRIWMWIEFIEHHQYYFPEQDDVDPVSCQLLDALIPFLGTEASAILVHTTPGVHAFAARVWQLLPASHVTNSSTMAAFFRFLRGCSGAWCGSTDELVEGCGEDGDVLASLVVHHIDMIATASLHPQAEVSHITLIDRLRGLSGLVVRIGTHNLFPALLSAGIVRAQTRALGHLQPLFHDAEAALNDCSDTLTAMLIFTSAAVKPGYPNLPEALKAGLLTNIVSYGGDYQTTARTVTILERFLQLILPGSLVFYPVVSALASALPKALKKSCTPRFMASPLFEAWQNFVNLAEERLYILEHFRSPEYSPTKACDSSACTAIRKSSEFKRCAKCRCKFYCSRECQIRDWRAGHRQMCKSPASYCSPKDEWRKWDEAFLRLILYHDYQALKLELLHLQLEYIRANGGRHDFYTTFDYMLGRCVIAVQPIGSSIGDMQAAFDDGTWCRSRLGLHIVFLNGGRDCIKRSYLFKSSSAALMVGLQSIWADITSGTISVEGEDEDEEVQRRLRELYATEVAETHSWVIGQ